MDNLLMQRFIGDSSRPLFLIGDERRLKTSFDQLGEECCKIYEGRTQMKSGHIIIKYGYKLSTSTLVVQVEDTGRGIAKEDLNKLFTRFGKLQRTANMNHEGIGLGLNIAKQIVELAEGTISAHSGGLGLGSIFSFSMQMEYNNDNLEY